MAVVGADFLITYQSNAYNTVFAALYTLFFIVHLFVRAYEYALPEKKIAEINKNLEATVEKRTEELTKANQILRELSIRDALTQAYNRMFFETEITEALEKYHDAQEKVDSIHLCIFDLDDFKQINDTFGHNIGDAQLIETVELARKLMPDDVVISRIGGEEFTLLFQNYTHEKALALVESLRKNLEEMSAKEGRTTGSFGLTYATSQVDRKTLFVLADECLYHSKSNGKNCITHNLFGQREIATRSVNQD